MSEFTVPIEVRNGGGTDFQTLDAWVDTGSFYSALPQPFLEALGVLAHRREQFMLADGTITERDLGRMWVRIGDRSEVTLVIFAEPESPPILGAYTLEGLALAVDPVNERLVPMPWLLRAALVGDPAERTECATV